MPLLVLVLPLPELVLPLLEPVLLVLVLLEPGPEPGWLRPQLLPLLPLLLVSYLSYQVYSRTRRYLQG